MRRLRPAIFLPAALTLGACGDGSNGSSDPATTPDAADASAETSATEPDATPEIVEPPGETTIVTLMDGQEVSLLLGQADGLGFEVPPDTLSVTITIVGEPGSTYVLGSWIGPTAELVEPGWFSRDQGGLCLSCDNRISASAGAFAAIAPNNPLALVEPGTHQIAILGITPAPIIPDEPAGCGDDICTFFDQFQCADTDCAATPVTGSVHVWVHAKVAKSGAALPSAGVLDLNLHFTGAQGLTAASAQTDPTFQATLQSMRGIYAQVGVSLGTITYRDIDARFEKIESLDGADSDLQEMFRLSEENSQNAVNLYFVNELTSAQLGGLGVILGIAGGIPGPVLLQGTHRSGVAIAIKPVEGAPAGIDTTMAHETGHFLGLFHTSEQAFFPPQIHDPLPDTPQNDESYLMFNTGAGNKLSPWQGIVMRESPWVKHPMAGGEEN